MVSYSRKTTFGGFYDDKKVIQSLSETKDGDRPAGDRPARSQGSSGHGRSGRCCQRRVTPKMTESDVQREDHFWKQKERDGLERVVLLLLLIFSLENRSETLFSYAD